MKKLTSYQKLQEKIKKLKEQKNELIKIIVEDDWYVDNGHHLTS